MAAHRAPGEWVAGGPGSMYLRGTARPVADAGPAALGRRGLGLRRHEGFGDLAPPPVLRPGKLARDAEARRRKGLLEAVAPLRGVQVRRPELWGPLLARLAAHAGGDRAATGLLRRMAAPAPDPARRAGLPHFPA